MIVQRILACAFLLFFFRGALYGAVEEKMIALTFDDGPNPPVLESLLPLLSEHHIPATFFVVGANAKDHRTYLRQETVLGHEIENHTFGHENLKKNFRSNPHWKELLIQSLQKTSDIIERETGRSPQFFRPPFWEINTDIARVIEEAGYYIVYLGYPDINSMDYDDVVNNRDPENLVARVKRNILAREQRKTFHHVLVFHELRITVKALETLIPYFHQQGYIFVRLEDLPNTLYAGLAPRKEIRADRVQAIYLNSSHIYNEKKISEFLGLITSTNANGIVIDFKDNNAPDIQRMKNLVARFRKVGAYTIARIVTFQDSWYAKRNPAIAIKNAGGDFWYSGRKAWERYWLDPATTLAQDYAVLVAKQAIDVGFNEIQFDYIRFPTDGNMRNIIYPAFNQSRQNKDEVMNGFFAKLHHQLKAYNVGVKLGIDVFGEVFLYGKERGIGQDALAVGTYFDVVSPMPYPSHYQCGEFGVKDPTAYPYKVYFNTLRKGLELLRGTKVIIRPWIQDFTIHSIYDCGPTISYTENRVLQEIKAGKDLGINGFMLWNGASRFTTGVFKKALSAKQS